ncbi:MULTISPECIES: hypothetical protein [Nitrospirillum]|uniref:Uncharacterized protein n=1 Tax=Nitrospirillum amazonense TaxID=28077 RepID=A0A560G6S8_9PROT|nr:hypothetical protein [Nitrospirillum amazonense]MEC4593131.1 hypothetical protein [Nitrospirillum amazonense]TWB29582.1 hypothetical protein FBZ88_1034 [Nitrospirillum amazonense]
MGTLRHFDLKGLLDAYQCQVYLETLTGTGDNVLHAASFGFERLFSAETATETLNQARTRLAGVPRAQLLYATREDVLKAVLPLVPAQLPILFWLDGHEPGPAYHQAKYGPGGNDALRPPLESLMAQLRQLRPRSRDVILVNGLRAYEDGPYADGAVPVPEHKLAFYDRNIDFVFRQFRHTHTIVRDYADDGYLALTPR